MFQNIITNKCDYIKFFKEILENFGGGREGKEKYVFRNNTGNGGSFPNTGAYFGCIREGEEGAGAYSDLSIVIFPSNETTNEVDDRWIIALGVGTLGFKNDYDLASLPGTRRAFIKYLGPNSEFRQNTFIKNDFLDILSVNGCKTFCKNNGIPATLDKAVDSYKSVLLVCTLFDPNNQDDSERIIKTYLAIYANLRSWPSKSERERFLSSFTTQPVDDYEAVKTLIENRRFVVLQGAPGTGKTRLAKMIPEENDIVFFTQFHAETSYSDFVYGIVPDVKSEQLKYSAHEGIFVKSVKAALENEDKKVFLIIDEINRANLSNVLGPAFYLFEPTMTSNNVEIEICPDIKLDKLPDNLYVIATMNTADRSLAVVDFALRRRFAWYTLRPHIIPDSDGLHFCRDKFNAISTIFEQYATDEELDLQPGHAYFIVSNDDSDAKMRSRLKYEVMPLIKEYLLDGMLSRAKDDFVNYFRTSINEEMFL